MKLSARRIFWIRFVTILFVAFFALSKHGFADVSHYRGGVSQAELSVPVGTVLGGYGTYAPPFTPHARRSTGLLGSIKVTAFAVQVRGGEINALVGVDAVGLRFSTVENIRKAVQSWNPEVRVLINASHSHSTPDTFGLWGELPNRSGVDPEYLKQLESKTIAVVREAVSSMRSVTLSWTSFPRSTLNLGEESPNEVTVVWMRDAASGSTLGSLTHWNAHPTVLPAENTLASADFVAFYRHFLEQESSLGGIHTFVNGYLAGVYPVTEGELESPIEPSQGELDPKVPKAIRQAAFLGESLAADAIRTRPEAVEIFARSATTESYSAMVSVTNRLFRLLMLLGVIEDVAPKGELQAPVEVFRLGPIEAVALPGEPSPTVAKEYLDTMKHEGVPHPLVFGQSGGMIGYLLDENTEFGEPQWKYQTSVSPSAQAATSLFKRFSEIFRP
jgi:hypothetical protein